MNSPRLYHFSDRGDIEQFVPRTPLRHPDSEPLVYALEEWCMPLYLFPRDCPRIGIWPTATTSEADRAEFHASTDAKMQIFIDQSFEESWRTGHIFRYTFVTNGFVDNQNYGDWVSDETQIPLEVIRIDDLAAEMVKQGGEVVVVESLAALGRTLYDYERMKWTTTLHVSMVRMGCLPDWEHGFGKPSSRTTA